MSADTPLPSDEMLLAEYLKTGSSDAFSQLVGRYVDLVHSAAQRQVRDAHLAEDVTQAVFVILTRRADTIRQNTSLAGWFLLTTRNVARNALRREWRLKRRERRAAEMSPEKHDQPLPAEAQAISAMLDDALARLGELDRNVIVQRFFQSRTHKEVGESLGMSQEAVSKRAARALEKLRLILEGSGVTATQASLAALLPIIAIKAAPETLAATVQASAAGAVSPAVAALAGSAGTSAAAGVVAAICAGVAIVVGIGAYVVTTMQAGAPPQAVPAAAPAPAAGARTITLLAIDPKTEQPIADASVQVQWDNNQRLDGTTDAQGRYVFNAPPEFRYLDATLQAEGRVPMQINWQNYTIRGGVPPVYTIPLETGTTIGGIVMDSVGNAVAGARVNVHFESNQREGDTPTPSLDQQQIFSDADGKWRIDNAPSNLGRVHLNASHPIYPDDNMSAVAKNDELRRLTATTIIQISGHTASGTVVAPDGKPVAGARVIAATDRYMSSKPTGQTDEQGRFELRNIAEHQNVLTVDAGGYAPQLVELPRGGNWKPVEIRLEPPNTIEAVVVDPQGNPVRGANVEVENWRGYRALEWKFKTDAEGRFTWKQAPADTVDFNVSLKGRQRVDGFAITAGKPPPKIVMHPPVVVTGKVIDAETKQPIPLFRMDHGIKWRGQDDVTWQTMNGRNLTDGKYDATLEMIIDGARLRVEANGYLPAMSRWIQSHEGQITLDFEMQKGSGPSGVVVGPDGKPVAGAVAYCITEDANLFLSDESDSDYNVQKVTTDKQGRFTFTPEEKPSRILIIADNGSALFGSEQLSQSGEIRLQPWARITGEYRINTRPASAARLQAQVSYGASRGQLTITRTATADGEGRFTIDRLPPGTAHVYQLIEVSPNMTRHRNIERHSIAAGQTLTVKPGGFGRPVVARTILPPGVDPKIDLPQAMNAHAQSTVSVLRVLGFSQPQSVSFEVTADGTIRAEDVPPGAYTLSIHLREPFDPRQPRPRPEMLGRTTHTFTVPAEPKCPTEEPLDLGNIQIQPAK